MKYKFGEKVRIREDLKSGLFYGSVNATDSMVTLAGKTCTIIGISALGSVKTYMLKEYQEQFHRHQTFSEQMFEGGYDLDDTTQDVLESIKNLEID